MANTISFEDLKHDAGDLRSLNNDDLDQLSKLIQRQLDMDVEIENIEATLKEMRAGKFALMTPVITLTEGRCVARIR